ncbi:MAG: S9 family peptidase [Bacteroidales bacterium]|nr:S9 family peptidase [Bacteroidales bacterium]
MKKIHLLILLFGFSQIFAQTSTMKQINQNPQEGQVINKMTPEFLWLLKRVSDIQLSPDGKTVLFGISEYDLKENKGKRNLFTMPVTGGEIKQISDVNASLFNAVWRPDGKKIGYLSAESKSVQIWEMNPDGSGKTRISNIPDGINAFIYSPDQKNILYIKDVKMEKTVQDLHPDLPKAEAMVFDDLMYRHWDAWSDFSYQHIFLASYTDGKMENNIDIMKDEPWDAPIMPHGGLEQISWSRDGKKLAYASKKLKGKDYAYSTNSDIYIYDLETSKTTNISSFNKGYDLDPVFSPDGKSIVWNSMKTPGFESDKKRIMIYDFATQKAEDYSVDFDQSSESFVWSEDAKTLYFISGIKATHQVYSLDIKTKKIRQITKGVHDITSIQLADKNTLVASKMSMSLPAEIFSINIKSGTDTQLSFVNKDLLNTITMGEVKERWVKTTDGKDMLVWVIYPPGFDPNKKYPTLLYTQGGPQSAVSQFFSYRWNFQIMAAHDYIVVAPNRRGLPTFGSEWNDQISQDYGGQNQLDYLSAIDDVAKESYVDSDRLGAVGASYGGFSVYWLAGNHNKRFKAFIAHCGMFNFESWYGSTEELFFANHDIGGPYWEKNRPKSYDFSPHNFVGNWDTPLLVIHGGRDFRIPYTEGMQAFNAAQIKDIPSRFLYFPDESHFVLKPQNSVLWQREFFKWLDTYLKK